MSAPKLSEALFMDRYRVLRELGRGGMGTVDVVYQIDLEREVALKRILPANVGLASAEGWFRREYRALAAIRHPGVPAIYDCGRSDESISYFTMEIIDGPSLRTALDGHALDDLEAVSISIELARILAAAHQVGVIHRDVKPANIILEAGGRVRLIDFGICFFLARFSAHRVNLRSVGEPEYRTGPMEIAGTVGYSDPALMSGRPPSVQSDVFSVCAVLYEMLARRRLYDEKAGTFHPIDTGEFVPELAAVVAEMRRGCQLLPKDRHASMDELIRCLEIARSTVLRARDLRPGRRGRAVSIGWSLANLGVIAILGGLWASERVVVSGPVLPIVVDASVSTTAATVEPAEATTRSKVEPSQLEPRATAEPAAIEHASQAAPAAGPKAPAGTGSIRPPQASRATEEPRHARTFADIMSRLEPQIRKCARKTGVADGPATVQVRSDPRSRAIGSVRVLKMSSEHPFAACVERVVRQASLPANINPIEDFTFLKTRGLATK